MHGLRVGWQTPGVPSVLDETMVGSNDGRHVQGPAQLFTCGNKLWADTHLLERSHPSLSGGNFEDAKKTCNVAHRSSVPLADLTLPSSSDVKRSATMQLLLLWYK